MYCVCSQRHHQWFCLHHLTTLLHTIQAVLPSLARNSCYFGLGLVYLRGDCLVSTCLSGSVGAMLALASFTQQTMLTGWGSVASLSHPSDVLCLSWLQVSQPYKHHIYIMTNMGHEVSSMITNMLIEHRSMAMSAIHRMVKQYDRTDPWLPWKCTPHHRPVGVNRPQSPGLTRYCSSSVVRHLFSRRLFGLNDVLQLENHRDVMFWENMSLFSPGSSRGSFRLSLPSNHVYSGPPWYDVLPNCTHRRVTGPSDTRLSHHTTNKLQKIFRKPHHRESTQHYRS